MSDARRRDRLFRDEDRHQPHLPRTGPLRRPLRRLRRRGRERGECPEETVQHTDAFEDGLFSKGTAEEVVWDEVNASEAFQHGDRELLVGPKPTP